LGLLIGKPVGILLFCWLLVKTKFASLPERITWKHMAGAGSLAGIGFTMSIFISNLAFKDYDVIQFAKVSVLVGSSLAVIAGLSIFFFFIKNPVQKREPVEAVTAD